MEDPGDRFALEDLEYAQRAVRGLRTSWGCIIAEFSGSSSEATIVVRVSGYLNSDPFLQLPHLRQDAEEVGLFLSDLANAELASRSNRHLMKCGLDWIDNGNTSQLFCLFGLIETTDMSVLGTAGRRVGAWLVATDIEEALRECQDPKLLSGLTEESLSTITRSVLQ